MARNRPRRKPAIANDIAAKRRAQTKSEAIRDRANAMIRNQLAQRFLDRCADVADLRRNFEAFMLEAADGVEARCLACRDSGVVHFHSAGTDAPCSCLTGKSAVFVDANGGRQAGGVFAGLTTAAALAAFGVLVAISPGQAPITHDEELVIQLAEILSRRPRTLTSSLIQSHQLRSLSHPTKGSPGWDVSSFPANVMVHVLAIADVAPDPDLVDRIGTMLVQYAAKMPRSAVELTKDPA